MRKERIKDNKIPTMSLGKTTFRSSLSRMSFCRPCVPWRPPLRLPQMLRFPTRLVGVTAPMTAERLSGRSCHTAWQLWANHHPAAVPRGLGLSNQTLLVTFHVFVGCCTCVIYMADRCCSLCVSMGTSSFVLCWSLVITVDILLFNSFEWITTVRELIEANRQSHTTRLKLVNCDLLSCSSHQRCAGMHTCC